MTKNIIKNTYIFGFFLKDNSKQPGPKKLFEYNQALLERNADDLHKLLEDETLTNIIQIDNYEQFHKEFTSYKNSIVNLGAVTIKYQNNLLEEIECNMVNHIDYSIN